MATCDLSHMQSMKTVASEDKSSPSAENSSVDMFRPLDAEEQWRNSPGPKGASTEAVLQSYASMTTTAALEHFGTTIDGLTQDQASSRLNIAGLNTLSSKGAPSTWSIFLMSLANWFNLLLAVIGTLSVVIPPAQWSTFTILIGMIALSCILSFCQEYRSAIAAVKLQEGVPSHVRVQRVNGVAGCKTLTVDSKDLVPGDILRADPGDAIHADCMILSSANLQVSQSCLTGESEGIRKFATVSNEKLGRSVLELDNLVFAGSSITSGSGLALVLRTGNDMLIATIMEQINKKRPANAFQRGTRNVSLMMIAFMAVMAPMIVVVSGKLTGNWGQAGLIGLAAAVGLVPEMLPAIVNANLARGAFSLSKKMAIVKRLESIQNLGSMSVLCSDKTGTLTKDDISLSHHLDVSGKSSDQVLRLAYVNVINQSGRKNAMDAAILKHKQQDETEICLGEKVAEIPFNFEARRSSCIIKKPTEEHLLICKGAYEEVSALCSQVRVNGKRIPFGPDHRQALAKQVARFNDDGYRVLLLATRRLLESEIDKETPHKDLDNHLTVEGLLTFLDPPKDDAKTSIASLKGLGVDVRVLTGDNLAVALKVCRTLDLVSVVSEDEIQSITGPDLAHLKDADFDRVVKSCKVFAKLTPAQKGQVIMSLKEQGEVVGMLGDGINDCVALRFADAGISVDSGAGAAKDCADIILTRKELSIIVDCVITGRITHGNSIKYIKMVVSSNFGNIFSLLIASCFLPFTPATSLQMLIQNLLYDFSQIALPWDSMDECYLSVPQHWSTKDLLIFVLLTGPLSSCIDVMTFMTNLHFYHVVDRPEEFGVRLAQTHWFLQSLLTQVLIVHLLRTAKVPFWQSRASKFLTATTCAAVAVGFAMPYIPSVAEVMALVRPENSFLGLLVAEMAFYAILVQGVKVLYIKIFGRWL